MSRPFQRLLIFLLPLLTLSCAGILELKKTPPPPPPVPTATPSLTPPAPYFQCDFSIYLKPGTSEAAKKGIMGRYKGQWRESQDLLQLMVPRETIGKEILEALQKEPLVQKVEVCVHWGFE